MSIFPLRLLPEMDLREELEKIVVEHRWPSCWIITGMGSLSQVSLRFAGSSENRLLSGTWEICSLSGTLCIDGVHLHMVVSNENGQTIGGHVGHGNIIRTTAEVVLGFSASYKFSRSLDEKTGFAELVVQERCE